MGSQWTGKRNIAGRARQVLTTMVVGAEAWAMLMVPTGSAAGSPRAPRTVRGTGRPDAAGLPKDRGEQPLAFGELSPLGALG